MYKFVMSVFGASLMLFFVTTNASASELSIKNCSSQTMSACLFNPKDVVGLIPYSQAKIKVGASHTFSCNKAGQSGCAKVLMSTTHCPNDGVSYELKNRHYIWHNEKFTEGAKT